MIPFADIDFNSLDVLADLDRAGIMPGPQEDGDAFRSRLLAAENAWKALAHELDKHGEAVIFGGIRVRRDDMVPAEIIAEGTAKTEELYGFAIREFPGFFLSSSVGWLWGGCLIYDTEIPLAVFLLRSAFRTKKRFFIYRRDELLAHELCHAVRQELHDVELEEFFAYQTSPSRLRRYLGNCFIRERDALMFMFPALLLLAAQMSQMYWWSGLWLWPFWLAALGAPLWLLARNWRSRSKLFQAERHLRQFGVAEPLKLLFRMDRSERDAVRKMRAADDFAAFVKEKCSAQLRWRIIQHRFLNMGMKNDLSG